MTTPQRGQRTRRSDRLRAADDLAVAERGVGRGAEGGGGAVVARQALQDRAQLRDGVGRFALETGGEHSGHDGSRHAGPGQDGVRAVAEDLRHGDLG